MKLDKYSENIIMTSEKGKAEQNYWNNKLQGETIVSSFPKDYNRSDLKNSIYSSLEYKMPKEVSLRLNQLSNKSQYAGYIILLACVEKLLYKYTGNKDIIVGMPAFKQKEEGKYSDNVLALRTNIDDNDTFKSLLEKTKNTVLEVDKNQNYPLFKTAELLGLQLEGDKYRFNTIVELDSIHNIDSLNYVNVDMKITFSICEDALTAKVVHDNRFYTKQTIDRIMMHFVRIFEGISNSTDINLNQVEILSEEEKYQLLIEFNDTKTIYPKDKTIQQLFEEQVEKSPNSIAVVYENKSLTYRELNAKSNQLARTLREKDKNLVGSINEIGSPIVIGIMVERSLEMIIGILAILKAGAAYLPIDTEYPNDRIAHMLEDSNVSILLTQSWLDKELTQVKDVIVLDNESIYVGSEDNLDVISNVDDTNNMTSAAYIMYTSGSTGKPKGVVIEHKSVVRLVKNTNYISFESGDRILQTGAIVFDACTFEFWGALLNGLELHIINKNNILEVDELERTLKNNKITILWLTSSLFNKIAQHKPEIFSSLRYLLAGGDVLSPRYINEVRRKCNGIKIVNGYGPTENTTFSTCHLIDKEYELNIPIGKPISNSTAYIIDKNNQLCPIGVSGELCVGGDGLAREYLNSPELTKEKFIENPFVPVNEAGIKQKMYRTGDLARWLPDGNIEFMGRIDHQVKIRGFRIELGEIEAQLSNHEAIKQVLVMVKSDKNGDKYLCAYYVSESDISLNEIKEHLAKDMPQYMIPSHFVKLDNMPLTANGKVDRKALPEPDKRTASTQEYVEPRNFIEEKVALVWQDVLGVETIGIKDNFFELGGDSIKAIQVLSRLNKYRLKFEVKDLFRYRNIEALSKYIVKSEMIKIEQGIVKGDVELTPIQQWFFEKKFTNMNHWNQSVMLYGKNGFDAKLVGKVFEQIVTHHDALRMIYKDVENTVLQYNRGSNEGEAFTLKVFDLLKEDAYESKLEEEVNRFQSSIDIKNGPLLKLALFKTKDGDHLLIAIHHLVIDGVSWRIIFEDFTIAYNQLLNNKEIKLQDKTHSYKIWAEKLKEFARGKEIKQEVEYWNAIESSNVPALPVDKSDLASKVKDIETIQLSFTEQETEKLLKEANKAYNTEINDILLAALGMTIKGWTSNNKVLVNLEGHGREEILKGIDITRTVGWFTSQYPVVLNMETDNMSFMIRSIKEDLRRIPNKGVGYGILKYLAPETISQSIGSLNSEISFNYLGQFGQDVNTDLFSISQLTTGNSISLESENIYKLNINGMITGNSLNMAFSYSKNEYDKETILGLAEKYKHNLIEIIEHCVTRTNTILTPSDVGCKDLTVKEFDKVHDVWGANIKSIYRLSPTQEGMLFHAFMDTDAHSYFQQIMFTMEGHVDLNLLEKSFNVIINRHDILRTNFIYEDLERPLQIVSNMGQIKIHFEDLLELEENDANNYIEEYKIKDRKNGFDLSKDMLIRLTLIKVRQESYRLIWSFHHILMDGWCLGIINKELFETYTAFKNNTQVKLKTAPSFRSYIDWLQKQDKDDAKDYWSQYLDGYENRATIPQTVISEPGRFIREEMSYTLNKEITEKISNIAKRNNTTMNIVLQAIWGLVLQRYNNTEDVMFGAVLSGRKSEIEGVEEIVGLFINTIPVRVQCDDNTGFTDLLARLQDDALVSEKHSYYPLAEIQGLSTLKGNLMDNILVFENYPMEKSLMEAGNQNGIGFAIVDTDAFQQTNYALEIVMFPGEEILVKLTYNSAMYEKWFMESLCLHIKETAEAIVSNPAIMTKEIKIVPKEEIHQILNDFNNTKVDYPNKTTVNQLFEEQVEKTPNNIAIIFEEKQLTYRQLSQRANQLARVLRQNGVTTDKVVGIMVERSLEMVVGIMAILKAGGAYLPIDPKYPADRISFMLEDSGAGILLTHSSIDNVQLAIDNCKVINLDEESSYDEDTSNLEVLSNPRSLAYVIYTSGSTGKPKGAMIEHHSIINRIKWMQKQYPINHEDVILQKTTYTFDVSVWELLWWSLEGAKVCMLIPGGEKDPEAIVEAIEKNKVTVMHFVPSMLSVFLEYIENGIDLRRLSSLKQVFASGEALTLNQVDRFNNTLNKNCGAVLTNKYGPTEAAVDVSYFDCSTGEKLDKVPIGKPIDNIQLYVIDKNMNLQPVGVAGELCIGGVGLARGYLNRADLTAEKFVDNPYVVGERMYRTGDLARWLPDGNIEYLGRIDHQVKIRGFRIELGEIETQLLRHENIKEALVMAKSDKNSNNYLCAYVVSNQELDIEQLKKHLLSSMPDYMIPAHVIQLDSMPLTANGKINRRQLPDPDESINVGAEYVAPRNEIEQKLAAVWGDVLGVREVGIKNSFFELGGDSIKAIQVVSRLNKYQLKLNIKDLFQYNTIAELAKVVVNADKDSQKITLEDFVNGYNQALNGKEINFNGKTYSFKEWLSKLKVDLHSKEMKREKEYWSKLEATEILPLQVDYESQVDNTEKEIDTVELSLTKEETEKLLVKANKAYNTEPKDILLTALGLTIKEWTKQDKVLINLDAGERKDIMKDIDLSAINWFTSQYPVLLNMKETDISYLIRTHKEDLRRIPNSGIGYGILRNMKLAENESVEFKRNPEISFSYLQQNNKNQVKTAEEKLTINTSIIEDKLTITLRFDKNQYNKATIQKIMEGYRDNINILIAHCILRYSIKNETKLTPWDVGCKNLSIREFDKTNEAWNNKIKSIYPLTSTQVGMLLYTMLDKVSHAYFEQACFVINGDLDVSLFRKSFQKTVDRHDALRTNFIYKEVVNPLQAVINKDDTDIYFEDITGLDEDSKNKYVEQFKLADRERGFDLEKDTLIRLSVLKTQEKSYEVIWSFHHIVMDGWCIYIINKDFFDIYYALKNNLEPVFKEVPAYKDYITWLEKQDQDEAKSYWSSYMENYESQTEIPKTKANNDKYIRQELDFIIDKTITDKLTYIAKRNNVTIITLIQSIWGVLLQRYNNSDDVLFGLITSGRNSQVENVEDMVGLFINTIPVRVQCEGNTPFTKLLAKMQENAIEAENYSYYPLADILATSGIKGSLMDNVLFDHILVFENFNPEQSIVSPDGDNGIGFTADNVTIFEQTNFEFSMDILAAEEIIIKCIYNASSFEKRFIESICKHIEEASKIIIETPDIPIAEIQFISSEEKEKMLLDFNNNIVEFPKEKTIYQLFEEQVDKTPDSIAVKCGEKELTYKQLNEKSNQLARVLRGKGLKTDDVVGIWAERSIEMLLGIMAVFKAGGAYLPIDPEYPEDRKKYMLEDSNAKIVLTQSHLVDTLDVDCQVVNLENQQLYVGDASNLVRTSTPADLAYVIYTSGSTGRPKGAMVEHVGMVNHIYAKINDLDADEKSIIAQNSSHCFDISVWQFLTALVIGGRTVIYPNEVVLEVGKFIEQVINDRITILEVVPSYLAAVLDYLEVGFKKFETLKYILVTGETVKPILVNRWFKIYPDIKMVNAYGPTEASDDITHYVMSEPPECNTIPIGKPVQNMTIYIVDEKMNLCPIGIKGEVCVSGIGVGRGYINDLEKTKMKFMEDPFINEKGIRLYKTGDLGRWLENGNIEFFGRMDYQVKIRGFRIELEEIEKALTTYPDIKESVVVDRQNASGDKYLCGYFVSNYETDIQELKKFLLGCLPDYMVPAYLMQLESLPLTPNGKVNRRALPEPEGNITVSTEYVAPTNEVEENLVSIWHDILSVDDIGIEHNFFELGGNSLKLISLVSKIVEAFDVELSHKQLFETPTIKGIAEILISGNYQEQNPLTLLNGKTDKNVFLFPPIGGFGLIYKDMADIMPEYSWYSFNYIEDDSFNLSRYIDYIKDVQKEGPYVLAGWSAGGNLAFEVAKELESQGQKVSDIILVDINRLTTNMDYSKEEIQNMVNTNLTMAMEDEFYKDYLSKNEFVRNKVASVMGRYMTYYHNHMVNSGQVNANIYMLLSTDVYDEGIEDTRRDWGNSTNGKYQEYQGVGTHAYMLYTGQLEENSEIMKQILNNIFV